MKTVGLVKKQFVPTRFTLFMLALLILDQTLKQWAIHSSPNYILNDGVIGGLYSGLNSHFTYWFALFAFSFVLIFGILTISLLQANHEKIAKALTLFFCGVTGNFIDRIFYGAAVDFIPIPFTNLVMNSADVYQWIGMLLFLFFMSKDPMFSSDKNKRIFSAADLGHQLTVVKWVLLVTLAVVGLSGLFIYSVLKFGTGLPFSETQVYLKLYVVLATLMLLNAAVVSWILSSKIVGPLKSFERFLIELKSNPNAKLVFRKSEQFNLLEKLANELEEVLKKD